MDSLLQDLRYALRTLRRSPAFTLAAVLTLALGIGANTAIFSVVDSVLLRPLPYPEADQIVFLWGRRGTEQVLLSIPDVEDFRTRNRTFERMGVVRQQSVSLTGGETPDRVTGAYVEADALSVLGAAAIRGRLFTAEETIQGAGLDVVVLSYGAWTTRFGGDPGIVGRTLVLDGRPREVIGVTAKGFRDPMASVDVWMPLPTAPGPSWYVRGAKNVWAVGRLKDAASIAGARSDLSAIAAQLATEYPTANGGMGASVIPLREQVVGATQPLLLTVLAFVSVVLLIACANVANLQLARAEGRHRELSVRAAIGAGWLRLARQLLVESLVLSVVGGACGLLLAMWATKALVAAIPGGLPASGDIGVGFRVAAFCMGLTILTGVAFGAAPALRGARADLKTALSLRAGQSGGGRRFGARDALVGAQLALCIVLLVGAGLLTRTFLALTHVAPGFEVENLLTAEFRLPAGKYGSPAAITTFLGEALAAVRAVPGVRSAALLRSVPLTGNYGRISYALEGQPVAAVPPSALQNTISDGFFSTMGIPFVEGRDFDPHDRVDADPVAIVSQEFARRSWPGAPALGKRITLLGPPDNIVTVVGVVGDIKQRTLGDLPVPQLYQPFTQAGGTYNAVVVRTSGDPAGSAGAVRAAIWSVDKDQPVWRVLPMTATLYSQVARPRFTLLLTGAFAVLALALAVVGVYGVMSYVLVQRTREMGIRMALGARRSQIVRLALGRGLGVVAVATVIGLFVAWVAARLIQTQLYGVSADDPLTFVTVPVVLGAVAAFACWLPARRAAAMDPVVALRSE